MEKEEASIKKTEDLNINTDEEENNNPCLFNKINQKQILWNLYIPFPKIDLIYFFV